MCDKEYETAARKYGHDKVNNPTIMDANASASGSAYSGVPGPTNHYSTGKGALRKHIEYLRQCAHHFQQLHDMLPTVLTHEQEFTLQSLMSYSGLNKG